LTLPNGNSSGAPNCRCTRPGAGLSTLFVAGDEDSSQAGDLGLGEGNVATVVDAKG